MSREDGRARGGGGRRKGGEEEEIRKRGERGGEDRG